MSSSAPKPPAKPGADSHDVTRDSTSAPDESGCPLGSQRPTAEAAETADSADFADIVVIDPLIGDLQGETARLRDAGPLTKIDLMGVSTWAVTRHAEARKLLTDSRLVKDINQWTLFREGTVGDEWPLIGMIDVDRSMFTVDGDELRRLRTKTAQAITPRRLKELEPTIERITHSLLDDLAERAADGPIEFKADFALPMPMAVVCELMGVDTTLHTHLHELYGAFFSMLTPQDERLAVIKEVNGIFTEMVRAKMANPGDDLTSALILADEGGEPLTEEELTGTLKGMVSAGRETTTGLFVNAVRALLTHPDQFQLVLDGEISWETVIEETLRWDSPVTHLLMRFATEDVQVGDQTIAKGESLVVSYRAIGRDTAHHGPDADEFDIRRPTPIRHMAFGHGPHVCPGTALARLEAAIALPAFFERFPGARLAVPPEDLRNRPILTNNELEGLPLHLTSP